MNITHPIPVLCAFLLITLSACSHQSSKEAAAESVRDTGASLKATRAQIDTTLASLNQMLTAQPAQLKPAYEQYSKDVDKMASLAKEADADAKTMASKSKAYLADWKKSQGQIKDQQLSAANDQRRTAVMTSFDGIKTSYDQANTSLKSFNQNLQDIRQAVSSDATPAGVQAIANTTVVKNANANGAETAKLLDDVQTQYKALGEALQPTDTPGKTASSSSNK